MILEPRAKRSGVAFTAHESPWSLVERPDRKLHLAVPGMLEWLAELDPADAAPDTAWPFVLSAGQRRLNNANQILRDPGTRANDPDGALYIHPLDLDALGLPLGPPRPLLPKTPGTEHNIFIPPPPDAQDAAYVAERVLTVDELKAKVGDTRAVISVADAGRLADAGTLCSAFASAEVIVAGPDLKVVVPLPDVDRLPELLLALRERTIAYTGVNVEKPSLDEVFFELTEGAPAAESGEEAA